MNNKIVFNNKTFTDANLVGGVNYIKDFAPDGEYCLGGAFCSSLDFTTLYDRNLYNSLVGQSFKWSWKPNSQSSNTVYTQISTETEDSVLKNKLENGTVKKNQFKLSEQDMTAYLEAVGKAEKGSLICLTLRRSVSSDPNNIYPLVFPQNDGTETRQHYSSSMKVATQGTYIIKYLVNNINNGIITLDKDITDEALKKYPVCMVGYCYSEDGNIVFTPQKDDNNNYIITLNRYEDNNTNKIKFSDAAIAKITEIKNQSSNDCLITLCRKVENEDKTYYMLLKDGTEYYFNYNSETTKAEAQTWKVISIEGNVVTLDEIIPASLSEKYSNFCMIGHGSKRTTNDGFFWTQGTDEQWNSQFATYEIVPKVSVDNLFISVVSGTETLLDRQQIVSYNNNIIKTKTDISLSLSDEQKANLTYIVYEDDTQISTGKLIASDSTGNLLEEWNMGTFVVKEITKSGNKMTIKAFDSLSLLDTPASVTLPNTIGNLLKTISDKLHVTFQDYSNEAWSRDTVDFNFTGQYTYRHLLNWIGEYEGIYFFGSKAMPNNNSSDIYFMKSDFPVVSQVINNTMYTTAEVALYETKKIEKVQAQSTFDDIGYIVGTGTNAYVITGNPLFYTNSKMSEQMVRVSTLYNQIKDLSYTPATINLLEDFRLDCGSQIHFLYREYDSKISDKTVFLMRKTINSKGVVFESVGSPTRDQVSLSTDPNIIALNNKTNELVRDVNQTKSTITTVTTKMDDITKEQSEIKQTSNEISATVTKLEGKVDKNTGDITALNQTTSEIKQTADGLTSTVTKVENKVDKNTGDITTLNQTTSTLSQTAEEIRQEVNGKVDGDQVQSAITTNLNGLTLSYNNSGVSGDNSCYITLSKDGVSIGGVVQMTNVTADTISASNITAGTLNADDISVNNSFAVKVNDTVFGYVGAALGSDATGATTYGASLRSADGNSYVIVTNGGVRMQRGNTSIWVTDEGISYRINGGSVVPIGYAVFS